MKTWGLTPLLPTCSIFSHCRHRDSGLDTTAMESWFPGRINVNYKELHCQGSLGGPLQVLVRRREISLRGGRRLKSSELAAWGRTEPALPLLRSRQAPAPLLWGASGSSFLLSNAFSGAEACISQTKFLIPSNQTTSHQCAQSRNCSRVILPCSVHPPAPVLWPLSRIEGLLLFLHSSLLPTQFTHQLLEPVVKPWYSLYSFNPPLCSHGPCI